VLDVIVAKVRSEVAQRSHSEWEKEIERRRIRSDKPQAFGAMLSRPGGQFIFEIKRKAPSSGELVTTIDVAATAQTYERHGAAAISVLTENEFFGGSLDDLQVACASVSIPCLRKDFIVDPLQIHEAAANGAAAILLIVAILSHLELREFISVAHSLQLEALVEVHDEFELSRALAAGARIIGVNNRNLKTMSIDLMTGERILKLIPNEIIRVAESGIKSRKDVVRLQQAGAQAFLIGSAIMQAEDIASKIQELRGI
jgi:indole-3-glycerol phosphate synthase